MIYEDMTKTLGNTPLVRLNRIVEGCHAQVLAKLEFFNPLSSIKDRIGLAMIETAEAAGRSNQAQLSLKAQLEIQGLPLPSFRL